ncbi:MAG: hypothetical protein WCJ66_14160 [Verrucomicrobiota bacterium]
MHWKILDLDRAQTSVKDVKRAYAQRLKNCRPDQDPVGFRRLHDAYQDALSELEWRSQAVPFPASASFPVVTTDISKAPTEGSSADCPAPPAATDASEPPEATATAISHIAVSAGAARMLEALDRLDNALKNDLPEVAERVREAEVVLFENPDEVGRWGQIMSQLISKHGNHPHLRLGPETLLFELEHESMWATLAVIDRLAKSENITGINGLAQLFLRHKQRISTRAGGAAATHLACAAATRARDKVGPLADMAYQNLASGERDLAMRHIDELAVKSDHEDPRGPQPRRVRHYQQLGAAGPSRGIPWRILLFCIFPMIKLLMLITGGDHSSQPVHYPIYYRGTERLTPISSEEMSRLLDKPAIDAPPKDWEEYNKRHESARGRSFQTTPPSGNNPGPDSGAKPDMKQTQEPPPANK